MILSINTSLHKITVKFILKSKIMPIRMLVKHSTGKMTKTACNQQKLC